MLHNFSKVEFPLIKTFLGKVGSVWVLLGQVKVKGLFIIPLTWLLAISSKS